MLGKLDEQFMGAGAGGTSMSLAVPGSGAGGPHDEAWEVPQRR